MFNGDSDQKASIERIVSVKEKLEKHYHWLFPRWQTLEDLEAILLERISLPNEALKQLAVKYPPLPKWYNEVDDQLTLE
jgi:hypothetical protein